MRPSDITDGMLQASLDERLVSKRASMRPSDITDGMRDRLEAGVAREQARFNEAVGYHRRNGEPLSVDPEPLRQLQ